LTASNAYFARGVPLHIGHGMDKNQRSLANSATQESDDSHADFICISQSLKRFNLLHK
jgi:hypothetical protein